MRSTDDRQVESGFGGPRWDSQAGNGAFRGDRPGIGAVEWELPVDIGQKSWKGRITHLAQPSAECASLVCHAVCSCIGRPVGTKEVG